MALRDFFTIGEENHSEWSVGFNPDEFLKVLPHPDVKVPYNSAWQAWQQGQADYKNGNYTYEDPNGLYYSSWGPDSDVVELELDISAFNELDVPGLGKLIANNPNNSSSYDDNYLFYNGTTGSSQGPLIVVDPGDTIKIKLTNNAPEDPASAYFDDTNLHTHGLHVSAQGNSDNVLITIDSGDSWETEIKVPDDHFVGPDWYHPHLHGATNMQVSKGMAGSLLIQPSTEETDDLDNFNPVTAPVYWMSLQTWGLNQEERPASSTDPVNQDPAGNAYRIATPPEFTTDDAGKRTYNVSEADYITYNYMPNKYNPETPMSGDDYYGFGLNGNPIENIIHTVNGQYNPTIDAKVGEWNLFGFLNFAVNSHHVIQLVREHEGELSLEEFQLVAVDGDVSGAAEEGLTEQTETPAIAPGARMTVQHAFTKPGKYYFLSNGTNEILGDLAPKISNTDSESSVTGSTYYGFNDGHLVWGPQVLATVDVTGDAIAEPPPAPEPWNYITKEQAEIDAWMTKTTKDLKAGGIKQREFVWTAMSPEYPKFGEFNGVKSTEYPGGKPSDNDPSTFEGAYRINGRFFGHTPQDQTVVAMPMLGTTEEWTIVNESYGLADGLWGEWHPFHIHQNDFVVTEINGLSTDNINAYPSNQLADTVLLGGAYIDGTQTADNPYGQAAGLDTDNVQPFSTKIRMRFEDFPGAYVNHCHILFHEDAGMMQAVKVILNTDSTILGPDQASESVNLRLGSDTREHFELAPYKNEEDNANFNVAIGDINYGKFFDSNGLNNDINYKSGTKGFSDNITDVATIQESKAEGEDFTIRVFDGDAVKQAATGVYKIAGFAPIAEDNMSTEVINEEANLKQLSLEGEVYLKKKTSNPNNHKGTGGPGTWGISEMSGMTYINDVFNSDGSYAGWNANTNPSKITGTNGEAIPSSYPQGGFTFNSSDGTDSLIADETHKVQGVDADGQGIEHYIITDGTGRFEDAKGEIIGTENYWGGADISLATNPLTEIKAKKQTFIDGTDKDYILKDITPFQDLKYTADAKTSLTVGDIDGDGHADIVAGIGGPDLKPTIEIYSGADYSLMGVINPFLGEDKTSINLAAGDINSDNFVDILVGQNEGGKGLVHAYDGRSFFEVIQNDQGAAIGGSTTQDVDPMNGKAMHTATELFTDAFQPFGDFNGRVDVSSGYINPRPEDLPTYEEMQKQVVQSSFANLIAVKTNSSSTKKNPSIKSFYYTGGSGHESHTDQSMASMKADADIPELELSINPNQKIKNVNGTFFDLSPNPNDRGYGGLAVETMDDKQFLYHINTDQNVRDNDMITIRHRRTTLTPGEAYQAGDENVDHRGTKGIDTITGGKGNDSLQGAQGGDILHGGKGDDIIKGNQGGDRLNGGSGNNTLKGGRGYDVFVINKKGSNTIPDLDINQDTIEVANDKYTLSAQGDDTELTLKSGKTTLIIDVDVDTLSSSGVIQVV